MTDTEAALMKAICADPDDDLPRLMLADHWEEHGQTDRAEFCRIQMTLAGPSPCPTHGWDHNCADNNGYALRNRERELLNGSAATSYQPGLKNRDIWGVVYHLSPKVPNGMKEEFRRGFPEIISCRGVDWSGEECQDCRGTGSKRYYRGLAVR